MGNCIEKLGHQCSPTHHSADGLQVFEDENGGYNGYCYACDTYVDDPYKDKPPNYKPAVVKKTPEQIAQELWDISQYPILEIKDRGLRKDTLEYFGYRVGVSQQDGITPAVLYRPYTSDAVFKAYKSKILDNKKTWSIGDQKEVDLFGWEQAIRSGSPKLIITEGEEDAVALYQIIRDSNKNDPRYAEMIPAVVSLSHGAAGSVRDLSRLSGKIRQYFKEIILAFDMDEVGQEWAKQVVAKVFGDAKIVNLPAKDANACLIEGRSKACVKAVLWQSSVPKNTSVKAVDDLAEAAKTPPKFGWSYPWGGLTEMTRGIRKGEVITLAAGVKSGKSSVVKQIASHLILEEGVNVLLISPEESPERTLQGMAGVVCKEVFIDPQKPFNEEKFDEGVDKLRDKLFILASYQLLNWETLKADIIYAIVVNNCEVVILDPLSNLIAGMTSSEANEFLNKFMPEIAKMALDYEVSIIITSHLKATETGVGHEENGKVLLKQLTGSRAIIRSSNLLLGLEGDLSAEDENLRKMRKLRIMADRNLGATGNISLWWNENTYTLEEVKL